MLTKAQGRTMVRQWLDDPNAKRWTDPNIDLAIQLTIDSLWSDILDTAPYLTSQLHVLTTIADPGYIDLRLATNGGMLTQRFYRVQQIIRGGREYYPKDPRDYILDVTSIPQDIVSTRFTWQLLGDFLYLHPLDTTTDEVQFRYSFKPTPFTAMTDGMNIPFPEGSEDAYILLAAASTMAKGNAEDAAQLVTLAGEAHQRMLNSIRRQYHGMTQPFTTGTSPEWGGT